MDGIRGHHKYYTSGVFYLPEGNLSINVYIFNIDDSTNKAEARVYSVSDKVRTSLDVAPVGLVEIISGRVGTFAAPVANGGLYEVEVYLDDPDKMNVVSQAINLDDGQVVSCTRILKNEYKKIDCFLG